MTNILTSIITRYLNKPQYDYPAWLARNKHYLRQSPDGQVILPDSVRVQYGIMLYELTWSPSDPAYYTAQGVISGCPVLCGTSITEVSALLINGIYILHAPDDLADYFVAPAAPAQAVFGESLVSTLLREPACHCDTKRLFSYGHEGDCAYLRHLNQARSAK